MASNTRWKTEIALRAGAAASALAQQYRADLEPRLGAGLIDHLATDLVELRSATMAVASARADKGLSTALQDDAAVRGHDALIAIRTAVRHALPKDRLAQKAFGVGTKLLPNNVHSITNALRSVLEAASSNADATRAAGVLPADIQELKQALDLLLAADATQEGKKSAAKGLTGQRTAVQVRVEDAVARICGAGALAFRGRPEVARQFAELLPSKNGAPPAAAPAAAKPS